MRFGAGVGATGWVSARWEGDFAVGFREEGGEMGGLLGARGWGGAFGGRARPWGLRLGD